eukprot:c8294_g1_i1 orf=22-204(-)
MNNFAFSLLVQKDHCIKIDAGRCNDPSSITDPENLPNLNTGIEKPQNVSSEELAYVMNNK